MNKSILNGYCLRNKRSSPPGAQILTLSIFVLKYKSVILPAFIERSNMINSNVWEGYGDDTMSRRGFYLALGCILTWGFFVTHLMSQATATWKPDLITFLAVGLAVPIIGILISSFSNNAIVSFIGFNLVVVPFGAILGPLLAHYELAQPGLVERTALLTAMVTGLMGLSGLMFPQFYRNIGGALFMALLCLLGVRVLQLFVPGLQNVGFIDYLAAGLFALYIGFDMWRASEIPANLDNAVDVAVSLYLDILNLFLNLLSILSKKD